MTRFRDLICCFPVNQVSPDVDDCGLTSSMTGRKGSGAPGCGFSDNVIVCCGLEFLRAKKTIGGGDNPEYEEPKVSTPTRFSTTSPRPTKSPPIQGDDFYGKSGVSTDSGDSSEEQISRKPSRISLRGLMRKRRGKKDARRGNGSSTNDVGTKTSDLPPVDCPGRVENRTTKDILHQLRGEGILNKRSETPVSPESAIPDEGQPGSPVDSNRTGSVSFDVFMQGPKIRPPRRLAKLESRSQKSTTKEQIDSKLEKAKERRKVKAEKFKEREEAKTSRAKCKKQKIEEAKESKATSDLVESLHKIKEAARKRKEAENLKKRALWEKRHRAKRAKRLRQKMRERDLPQRPGETDEQFLNRFFMDGPKTDSDYSDEIDDIPDEEFFG